MELELETYVLQFLTDMTAENDPITIAKLGKGF